VLAGFPDFWVNAAGASTACGTGRRSEPRNKAVQGTFALMTPELSRSTNFLRNRYWNLPKSGNMPVVDCVFDSRLGLTGGSGGGKAAVPTAFGLLEILNGAGWSVKGNQKKIRQITSKICFKSPGKRA
jgi:hypothetical protein